MMVNMPGWEDALARPGDWRTSLGVGLHLNLIAGQSLTRGPSITDRRTGRFHSFAALAWRAATGRVRADEVRAECEAQLGRLTRVGLRTTHVDSHRHTHCFPGFFAAVREAAHSCGVRVIRVPREPLLAGPLDPRATFKKAALAAGVATSGARAEDVRAAFFGVSLQESPDFLRRLLRRLDTLPMEPSEIVVHPGYASPELARLDAYTTVRERELAALTSAELRSRLLRGDIELVSFAAL